jgi:hypothetical protein
MSGMLGSLGMDDAVDVARAIYDAQNDSAYETNYESIDQMTDGLANGLERFEAEYYELDNGLAITPEGTSDAFTGDPAGGFSTDDAANQFVADVANDVHNNLLNTDFVEVPSTSVDNEFANDVEGNGVDVQDNDFTDDVDVPVGNEDGPGGESAVSGEDVGGIEAGVEAGAAFL